MAGKTCSSTFPVPIMINISVKSAAFALAAWPIVVQAQSLPDQLHFSPDGRMLLTGGQASEGLYDEAQIREFRLEFDQPNYWTLMQLNYDSKTNIQADLTVDGEAYPGVGVRFKGQTSYLMVPGQKKSFNISANFTDEAQEVEGYETFNLNNCFGDPSFIREVFYLNAIRNHIPAAQASYVRLYINDEDWGLYPHVQQLNSDFVREWWMSNNGSLWRADTENSGPSGPGGPGGPGGGGWGDGTAALNYLGSDSADYQEHYTLKRSERNLPWEDLIHTCDALENGPISNLIEDLSPYLDIDRTLWFLAAEILFSDDDSYVYKGKMDYWLYLDDETGRITPQEYDGNSVMEISNDGWSVFYHANDDNYPLLYRLLQVPELRQRYLAHVRTLLNEVFEPTTAKARIDAYAAFIDAQVASDPKKLYTYSQFTSEVNDLKTFIDNRWSFYWSNSEVATSAPVLSNVEYASDGVSWQAPGAGEAAMVTAQASHGSGMAAMRLYYGTGIMGTFESADMHDDGAHGDGAAGDGVYGAEIPGYASGTSVRFYVEAEAANTAGTLSYDPPGAEHDIYYYRVALTPASERNVVINELLASNDATAADEAGQFDDWIELYNTASTAVDIGGWTLSDKALDLGKWSIPDGTVLEPGDYLIVWADEDESQGIYHSNFKLSADGEELYLLNSLGELADSASFSDQTEDMAYARNPNGTGSFVVQSPTYHANNETGVGTGFDSPEANAFSITPNPVQSWFSVKATGTWGQDTQLKVFDALGRLVHQVPASGSTRVDASSWSAGVYLLRMGEHAQRMVILD